MVPVSAVTSSGSWTGDPAGVGVSCPLPRGEPNPHHETPLRCAGPLSIPAAPPCISCHAVDFALLPTSFTRKRIILCSLVYYTDSCLAYALFVYLTHLTRLSARSSLLTVSGLGALFAARPPRLATLHAFATINLEQRQAVILRLDHRESSGASIQARLRVVTAVYSFCWVESHHGRQRR